MRRQHVYLAVLGLLVLLPLILMGIGLHSCYRSEFALEKISSKLHYNEEWETKTLSFVEREWLLKEVLSQKFYFLGSGGHSYVFVSEDDKYVLKFFKMYKILPKNWLRDFPFSLLETYRFNHVEKREHLFASIFRSFKMAFQELRQETGLLYLHLNKTRDLKTKLTLVDQVGKKLCVDLDTKEFVVQKKAMKLSDYFLACKKNGDEEKLRRAVNECLALIARLCKKGYEDGHGNLRNNIGFVDEKAIFFDCGLFFADESLKSPHCVQMQILSTVEILSHWAEQSYPDLIYILQEEAQRVIDAYVEGTFLFKKVG